MTGEELVEALREEARKAESCGDGSNRIEELERQLRQHSTEADASVEEEPEMPFA